MIIKKKRCPICKKKSYFWLETANYKKGYKKKMCYQCGARLYKKGNIKSFD